MIIVGMGRITEKVYQNPCSAQGLHTGMLRGNDDPITLALRHSAGHGLRGHNNSGQRSKPKVILAAVQADIASEVILSTYIQHFRGAVTNGFVNAASCSGGIARATAKVTATVGSAHDYTSWLQENRPKKPEKKVTYLFIPGDSFVNKI
jgi:hypothetical protein